MRALLSRLKQARRMPPVLFIIGTVLAFSLAYWVYWNFQDTRWYLSLSAVYQLLGIVIAFWQVVTLRKELRRPSLWKELSNALRPPEPICGSLEAHEVGSDTASVNGILLPMTVDVMPLEEQVKDLRAELFELKQQLTMEVADFQAHKSDTTSELMELRSRSDEKVRQLQEQIANAVTSKPWGASYGVLLVFLGSWMQLVVAVCHPSPPEACERCKPAEVHSPLMCHFNMSLPNLRLS